MAFDFTAQLATVRARVGLADTDTSRDAELEAALHMSLELMENYCNRKFAYEASASERFTHVSGGTVSLERYPIERIDNIVIADGSKSAIGFHLEADTGLIHFDGHVHEHQMDVTYAGGYHTLPFDLALALLMVFDGVWNGMSGGGSVAAGAVESATITGVGTVRFNTGAASDAAAGGGLVTPDAIAILGNYRRVSL